ncbi:MAG TPA: 1-acyl-sn-glycerol-3-phosphate acyltransferase [Chitinophagaceae bacterium]|nr:1-acyl-sn-glycerol-3-phosphate acyltransferase [Chitinophagaceae bacterium]
MLIVSAFPITLILLLFAENVTNQGMFCLLKFICNAWYILTGMWPKNFNRDKIDFNRSYIITPNHQSIIDAATIYTSIPHLFKTLGKKEIEKTPIYGVIYKTVVITVDRSSLKARALSFRQMKQALDKNISILIFPEGTFSDSPDANLLPFQNGAFGLSILQQTPLLPVLFPDSASRIHPSKMIRCTPGWNRAVFLPPVSVEDLKKEDQESLKRLIQAYMQACLNHCRNQGAKSVWNFAMHWMDTNRTQFLTPQV